MSGQLAIVGAYPPPHGGVTTHVKRLVHLLEQRGIAFKLYDVNRHGSDNPRIVDTSPLVPLWMLWFSLTCREQTIYLVSQRLAVWMIGALMVLLRGKVVMIRLPNMKIVEQSVTATLRRRLTTWSLAKLSRIVCVNQEQKAAMVEMGIEADKIGVYPGFLPPLDEELEPGGVSSAVWTFCENRSPILCANGKVDWWQEQDLYGLDLMVELIARLKPEYPSIALVVCFWDHLEEDRNYLGKMMQRVEELGISDNVLFNTEPGYLLPVINAADMFLRPTNTDGDANSLREALQLGVAAVASDAVTRPDGSILFRNRDIDDFEQKVRSALGRQRTGEAGQGPDTSVESRSEAYIRFITG